MMLLPVYSHAFHYCCSTSVQKTSSLSSSVSHRGLVFALECVRPARGTSSLVSMARVSGVWMMRSDGYVSKRMVGPRRSRSTFGQVVPPHRHRFVLGLGRTDWTGLSSAVVPYHVPYHVEAQVCALHARPPFLYYACSALRVSYLSAVPRNTRSLVGGALQQCTMK